MDWLIPPRRELYYLQASQASMMQQFCTKTFFSKLSHTLTYPFLILFKPKFPFMRNVWLGIYHYGNHSLTVVSFCLKHASHLEACGLYHGQYFQIHYYFAQTVISTGNLHLAVACVCRGNWNQTPVRVQSFFSPLLQYKNQRGISKQPSENVSLWSKRKLGCKIGAMLWL